MQTHAKKAFTLVEVLLVVVIIAILAGIVIVAINPARQIAQSNNAQRDSDVRALLDAVTQFSIDNRGVTTALGLTSTATTVGSASGQIDICSSLVPTYLSEMPFDPTATGASYTDCSSYSTGYTIAEDSDGRITIAAPSAELSETITITR